MTTKIDIPAFLDAQSDADFTDTVTVTVPRYVDFKCQGVKGFVDMSQLHADTINANWARGTRRGVQDDVNRVAASLRDEGKPVDGTAIVAARLTAFVEGLGQRGAGDPAKAHALFVASILNFAMTIDDSFKASADMHKRGDARNAWFVEWAESNPQRFAEFEIDKAEFEEGMAAMRAKLKK